MRQKKDPVNAKNLIFDGFKAVKITSTPINKHMTKKPR